MVLLRISQLKIMLRHLTTVVILFSIFSILSACSSIATYPENWATPMATLDDICPDISGKYFNAGILQSGVEDYLYDKITCEGIWGVHEAAHHAVRVKWIDSKQDQILIRLENIHDGDIVEEKIIGQSDGDFICSNGAVEVQFDEGFEVFIEGYIQSGVRRFFLAEDGSLILEQTSTTIGHTWIYIPLGVKVREYSKWEKVTSEVN
ncbi:MAG: hypothetical protein WBO16_10365 [Gammaproteobacteria bacterium]|jgi:hypothetical protein